MSKYNASEKQAKAGKNLFTVSFIFIRCLQLVSLDMHLMELHSKQNI